MKLVANVVLSFINSGNKNQLNKCVIMITIEKLETFISFVKSDSNRTEYKLRNNIVAIRTTFLNEGKITIQLKHPEVYILISKAKLNEVKSLVDLLNFINQNKQETIVKSASNSSKMITKEDKELLQTSLTIQTISKFPVCKGYPMNLCKLKLTDLKMKKFDNRILRLQSLMELYFENLLLEELPIRIDCLSLSILSIVRCRLKRFPLISRQTKLSNSLVSLDLSGNNLKRLPDDLWFSFPNLRFASFDGNNLDALPAVGLNTLKCLMNLDIANNNISILPNAFLSVVSQLSICNLTNAWADSVSSLAVTVNRKKPPFQPISLLHLSVVALQRNAAFFSELLLMNKILPRHVWLKVSLLRYCHSCHTRVPPSARCNWVNLRSVASDFHFSMDISNINPVLIYYCDSCVPLEQQEPMDEL